MVFCNSFVIAELAATRSLSAFSQEWEDSLGVLSILSCGRLFSSLEPEASTCGVPRPYAKKATPQMSFILSVLPESMAVRQWKCVLPAILMIFRMNQPV